MHWVLNAYVRRYHQDYQSSGHLWQGRFKAFPIEQDDHLLTVLRYVERNAVRARLARRAESWNWSSAKCWKRARQSGWAWDIRCVPGVGRARPPRKMNASLATLRRQ